MFINILRRIVSFLFQNTTEWLLTAVTKKDNNDLLTTVKLQTEFHFRKIKQFYDQLIETFNMASNIEVRLSIEVPI